MNCGAESEMETDFNATDVSRSTTAANTDTDVNSMLNSTSGSMGSGNFARTTSDGSNSGRRGVRKPSGKGWKGH